MFKITEKMQKMLDHFGVDGSMLTDKELEELKSETDSFGTDFDFDRDILTYEGVLTDANIIYRNRQYNKKTETDVSS